MLSQQQLYQQQMRAQQAQARQMYQQQVKAQRDTERAMRQQQTAMQREYNAQCKAAQKEYNKNMKYPALTDNFIRTCLTREIYLMYQNRGIVVPEPTVLMTQLKFRRVKANSPAPYMIGGKKVMGIKHACAKTGVSLSNLSVLPIIYYSPNGSQFNHDYHFSIAYRYCPHCKAVIYFFNSALGDGN